MPSIVKELNLNKHPKDCKDLSLVYARNVMVSNDLSCLQNEYSITGHSTLNSYLNGKYVAGYIPCNTEVVLFVVNNINSEDCTIIRYDEKTNSIIECTNKFKYYGGKIKGTFTYNVKGDLIIAVAESDSKKNNAIPLRTINLGQFDTNTDGNDKGLTNSEFSINPEIKLPSINNLEYIVGNAYKGWYHFFIRFKVNSVDYTKWYHIGYPVFICDKEKQQIFKYGFANYWLNNLVKHTLTGKNNDILQGQPEGKYYLSGALDYFSSDIDISNETIEFDLNFNNINLNYYQIGFICVTKNDNKAFRTNDISKNITKYTLDISKTSVYSVEDLIRENYNYYNVKNITNYDNRLYIADYSEKTNPAVSESNLAKIKLTYTKTPVSYNDIRYEAIKKSSSQGGTNGSYIDSEELQQSADVYGTSTKSTPSFINTNLSYKDRRKNNTLIPGEIYSFYIHFVNKYGEATDGYKLQNENGYAVRNQMRNSAANAITSLRGNNNDIEWYQLPLTAKDINSNCFIPFENTNGDKLFKVPFDEFKVNGNNIETNIYTLNVDASQFELPEGYIGYYLSYEKFESTVKYKGLLTIFDASKQEELGLTPAASELVLADAHISYGSPGYYAGSPERQYTINTVTYKNYNKVNVADVNIVNFYTSNLDINDSVELDVNYLFVTKKNCIKYNYASYGYKDDKEYVNGKFPANLNAIEQTGDSVNKLFDINNVTLAIANEYSKNKEDVGTSIQFPANTELATILVKSAVKAYLIKLTRNIYISETKNLIKFTDIYYNKGVKNIKSGLNGFITYNDFLVYDYNRFILDSVNNLILSEQYGQYYASNVINDVYLLPTHYEYEDGYYSIKVMYNHRAPLYYIQLATFDNILNESKSFKVKPELRLTVAEYTNDSKTGQMKLIAKNQPVTPAESINLFEIKYAPADTLNPKSFIARRSDYAEIDYYNKRIRRSNVISDESLENNWRWFGVDQYKDITENKGKITNLIGIGLTLLVHTEHSLFAFDKKAMMESVGQNVQLAIPDTFDIQYKEVFTSNLGICGLQDSDAYIVDQFGYVFYDNDNHRIYKFGQQQIESIDNNIIQFLNKYKPYRIRFANDKESNRLIVTMQYVYGNYNEEFTLSYNYIINAWISFHGYTYNRAFNTKNMLYYLIDSTITKIYTINNLTNYSQNENSSKNINYNNFENTNIVDVKQDSRIDIIINAEYDIIKYLEYIIYKLYKVEKDNGAYSHFPVEELRVPYSGDELRVFNTEVDTYFMNILINSEEEKNKNILEHTKPYWELGNWNFNYLRDKKQIQDDENYPSRLYGNYFVVSFILKDDFRRIEFESLGYFVSKDKK